MAIAQAQMVISSLKLLDPSIQVEMVTADTAGDRDQASRLTSLGGKGGSFVSGFRHQVLVRQTDMVMHSLKDIPGNASVPGLILGAFLRREDPRDALVTKNDMAVDDLPTDASIGTNSVRRKAFLRQLFPLWRVLHCRGAANSRLRKLDSGELQPLHEFYKDYDIAVGPFDALVMAKSGLERIGCGNRIQKIFSSGEMIPAVGQGTVVVECREDDHDLVDLLHAVTDPETELACIAERAMLHALNGHCNSPIAGYCRRLAGSWILTGAVLSEDGSEKIEVTETTCSDDLKLLGGLVASKLLLCGARGLIEKSRRDDALAQIYEQAARDKMALANIVASPPDA